MKRVLIRISDKDHAVFINQKVENEADFRHNDFVLILDICPGGEIGRRTTLRW